MTLLQRAEMLRGNNEQGTKQDNGEKIAERKGGQEFPIAIKNRRNEETGNREMDAGRFNPISGVENIVQEIFPNWFDRLILYFVTALKNIAFLFSALADLSLACFFYYSLGYDTASRIVLSVFGFVQTGGKLWAWSTSAIFSRKILAAWCAALSILATVSVFLAVIETQSQGVNTGKSYTIVSIENDIGGKQAENKILAERLKNTPIDYISASKQIAADIRANNEIISNLTAKLEQENISKPLDLRLDAWKIFSQFTNFKWQDMSHIYALCIVLMIAGLLEILIYATTPRRL